MSHTDENLPAADSEEISETVAETVAEPEQQAATTVLPSQEEAQATPAQAQATAAPAPAPAPAYRTGPRTGPIIWGALILAFCAYVGQRAFGSGSLDAITWITITTIGLGVLLLIVGVTVVLRGRRNK